MIVRGIHLPEGDQHFAEQIQNGPLYRGKGTYQFAKLQAALEVCGARRGHAVDVGAHVGLWSRVLSYEFKKVTAFEPIEEYAECWKRNLNLRRSVATLHQVMLMYWPGVSNMHVSPDGVGTASWSDNEDDRSVVTATLDSFGLEGIDFIKIDCEGAELAVLKGAKETILRCKPVVLVEQKRKRTAAHGLPRDGAVEQLKYWGAELISEMKGDFLLRWPQ